MAQAVSRQPLTTETRLRARVTPCGIYGRPSGVETGFTPSSSVLPCQYNSTVVLHTHCIWGMNNKPVGGRISHPTIWKKQQINA
jgi:hypothetical protein